jgi:hypothetical protein
MQRRRLTLEQRKAVTKKLRPPTSGDRGPNRRGSIDAMVELTVWHRDHARGALREVATIKVVRPSAARTSTFTAAVVADSVGC